MIKLLKYQENLHKIDNDLRLIRNIIMEYQKIVNFLDNTSNQLTKVGKEFGFKQMMNHVVYTAAIVKLKCK